MPEDNAFTAWTASDAIQKALERGDQLTAFRIEQQHRSNELLEAILQELKQSNDFLETIRNHV